MPGPDLSQRPTHRSCRPVGSCSVTSVVPAAGSPIPAAVASFANANDSPGSGPARRRPSWRPDRYRPPVRHGCDRRGSEGPAVRTAYEGKTSTGLPRWSFVKVDQWMTCYMRIAHASVGAEGLRARPCGSYYSRGFPLCGGAAAQRDSCFRGAVTWSHLLPAVAGYPVLAASSRAL